MDGIEVNAQGPQNFGQNAFSRTSRHDFKDVNGTVQHAWTIGTTKVNEARFQYSRRGLLYSFSTDPHGQDVAVNIPGVAFLGREPFSFVKRTEQRYQGTDSFSWTIGKHSIKFGGGRQLPSAGGRLHGELWWYLRLCFGHARSGPSGAECGAGIWRGPAANFIQGWGIPTTSSATRRWAGSSRTRGDWSQAHPELRRAL